MHSRAKISRFTITISIMLSQPCRAKTRRSFDVKHDKHGKMRFYGKKRNGFMGHLTILCLPTWTFSRTFAEKGLKRSDLAMKKIEK